jgi:hypothetical protein
MKDIVIQQAEYNGGKGKIGILMYVGSGDPVPHLDAAVHSYVRNQSYNEYIDANMDNPWIRIIVKGINEMDQTPFNPNTHWL